MKVVILAAGYATRLSEVTNNGEIAKTVLPITKEGKTQPMLYFLLDKVNDINFDYPIVDSIIVATNAKYYKQIKRCCEDYNSVIPIEVLSNGTTCKEEALGANADLQFVNDYLNTNQEILVVASDNYFDFKLTDLVNSYYKNQKKQGVPTSMIVSKKYPETEKERIQYNFGMLKINNCGKVETIVEKPLKTLGKTIDSTNVSIACYLLNKQHLDMIDDYMVIFEEDNQKRDALGHFIGWLADNFEIYNFSFGGEFVDIGTPEQYYQALNGKNSNL